MKKLYAALLFPLIALPLLGSEIPSSAQKPENVPRNLPVVKLSPSPIRAMQVLNLDCPTLEEAGARFREFREAGANTVIVRVFHNPGDVFYGFVKPKSPVGVYFQTKESPVVQDILGALCELAHGNGLKIFAWMTTRYADYGIEDRQDIRCVAYNLGRKKYERARGLSVILPEARTRLVRLYDDLARYPVDGILIQDDMMLRHNEDFNPRISSMYRLSTGKSADPSRFYNGIYRDRKGNYLVREYTTEFWLWSRWKRDRLLDLADELRRTALSRRPGIKFGLNFYYETVTDPGHGLAWFSQDLEAAVKRNYDFYAIMLYHRQMKKELGLSSAGALRLFEKGAAYAYRTAENPARVMIKVQTVDWDRGIKIPCAEINQYFSVLKKEPRAGWAFMPAGAGLDLECAGEQFGRIK